MIVGSSAYNLILIKHIYIGSLNVDLQAELFTIKGYFDVFVSPIPEKLTILDDLKTWDLVVNTEH